MNPTNLLMFSLPAVSRRIPSLSRNLMAVQFTENPTPPLSILRAPVLGLVAFIAVALSSVSESHAVILSYDVSQDFVDGEGDHDAYMPDGFDGFTLVTGVLTFALPNKNNQTAYETGHFRDTSGSQPLTLTFGGATFHFGGPIDLNVSVPDQHISITAWGDDAVVRFNFFSEEVGGTGPPLDADPFSNFLNLSLWGGHMDFRHANGSYLYTDWGGNVSDATIIKVPDVGSTLLLLCLGLGGLGVLARLRKTA